MRKLVVLSLLIFMAACSPAAPATPEQVAVPETVAVQPTVEVASVGEVVVEEESPIRWEYKTVSITVGNNDDGIFGEMVQDMDTCEVSNPDMPSALGRSCFLEDQNTAFLDRLNALGSDGWELVQIVYSPGDVVAVAFLKRVVK